MRPLACPSAPPAPGPFDIAVPHILPWLVLPLLVIVLCCFLIGGFKTVQNFWRGIVKPKQRWLCWLQGLGAFCFAIGYPPIGLLPVWSAALDAWNENLRRQGCALDGVDLALVAPHTQDGFANWLIVGGIALAVFVALHLAVEIIVGIRGAGSFWRAMLQTPSEVTGGHQDMLRSGQSDGEPEAPGTGAFKRRLKLPGCWNKGFFTGAMMAIALAAGVEDIVHGEALLQSIH